MATDTLKKEEKTKQYNIVLKGYRLDSNNEGLPTYGGIFFVYRCKFNPDKQTVKLKELLYIGQANNIKEAITESSIKKKFDEAIHDNEQLCYSYAEVPEEDVDIIADALIFAQQPPLNDKGKDGYRHSFAKFLVEGKCGLLKYSYFSVTP